MSLWNQSFQCKVLRDEDGELGRLELSVLLETPHWQLLEFSILTFSWVLGCCSRCLDVHLGRLVSPLWQLEGWLSAISASVPHCPQQSCAQTWTGSVWNCVADLHSLACRPQCSPGVVWWPALWRPKQRILYIWVCIILLQSYMWSLPHKALFWYCRPGPHSMDSLWTKSDFSVYGVHANADGMEWMWL